VVRYKRIAIQRGLGTQPFSKTSRARAKVRDLSKTDLTGVNEHPHIREANLGDKRIEYQLRFRHLAALGQFVLQEISNWRANVKIGAKAAR